MRSVMFCLCLFLGIGCWAQQPDVLSSVKAEDPNDELGKLKKNCFAHIMGCAEVLFTGQPIHIAVGSIAPQNGFSAGLAYVRHKNFTNNWSMDTNADAVASPNGSWRAGVYLKFVNGNVDDITPQFGTHGAVDNPTTAPEQPVITAYAQTISLNQINDFGLGAQSQEIGRSYFGMRETIAGITGVQPLSQTKHLNFYGELNGRWVDLRPRTGQASPSIEQLYDETTAPGLTNQPFYLQLGAGVRYFPSLGNHRLHLNYDVNYKPYFAVSDSHFSFQRFSATLSHQVSLYRTAVRTLARDTNGPDDCSIDLSNGSDCPKVSLIKNSANGKTRNFEGTLGITFYTSISATQGSGVVPFYLQPTLGGGDMNGNPALASYQDYRFRAPNFLMFRENFEHSIWKLPVGFIAIADQANLALRPSDLGTTGWKHSYSTGLTLRAGGFPMVYLLFSWGGKEGTHFIGNINTSLLGGSQRPSLF